MAFQLNRAFEPVVDLFTGNSGTKRKRSFRYAVKLKGRTLSKHFTKTAAKQAAKKIRGATFVPIRKRR